ncbi:MAG: phosphoglucosamine mutase [Candidatus Eremiobacteraeota bacterium]|nr:phosphoglucosamine mutase [Candidatus Eremiobacteraeota bacterium]
MKIKTSLKIGISGVRGIVGESLTPQLCAAMAQAFGTYVGGGTVILGRDSRTSGEMIKGAVLSGLLSVGCRPVDIGICPTPSIMIYTREARASGAIEITASHNPKEWNGLKFINSEGLFLNGIQVKEFLDIYHQGEFSLAGVDKQRPVKRVADPTKPHLEKLFSYFDVESIRKRRFKVAVDCANGAGAVLSRRFLEELGCTVAAINEIPDGAFAHPPEPLPENITELCRKVTAEEADVGFVQDADADRLAVVNEKGEPMGEDMTLVLAVRHILGQRRGTVVTNLSASRAIDDVAAEFGVPVVRTRIGEINVVERMCALGGEVAVGGEGNGGVIIPAIHPCRDSFTAMAVILEAMAKTSLTVSQLAEKAPAYCLVKAKIPGSREEASRLVRQLKKRYEGKALLNSDDGLKLDFPGYWLHVRPSNTEPIIRVFAEARTRAAAEDALGAFTREIEEIMAWK